MNKTVKIPTTIDEYIAGAPVAVRPILKEIQRVVRAAAPDAAEVISYRMPAFKQNGIVIYFAAFQNHIGIFPPVSGDAKLEVAVKPFAGPKGNLKFPLNKPIPYALIGRIVRHNVKRNMTRTTEKPSKQARLRSKPQSNLRDMHPNTKAYNDAQAPADKKICQLLAKEIALNLPEAENKVWHAHPVWFLDGNPIVGYSKLKTCVRLLFWSGQSFKEKGLKKEGTFKAAEARYTDAGEIDLNKLQIWLGEARKIQWDYKNIVRRKGRLLRL